ncbi:MAG: preprotein translocase subunit YajC [Candidatus Marinimicrobia bacterium]|nr:preprotein translocase subunit YajC [Candidatus Neomarinimicrobiota bacterium]
MLLEIFAQQAKQGFNIMGMLPFILIFVVIWFFMMRPQAKKQKETKKMLDELKPKDKVVTIGGIYGEVDSVKDYKVVLKVGKDATKIEVKKSAIASKQEMEQLKK